MPTADAVDLGPAAKQLADLLAGVPDDALDNPTPCPDYTLGDLIEHVGGFAMAFTAAAKKDTASGATGQAPSGDAARLGDDWRTRIPADLTAMAEAWRDPEAWTGMTQAGGLDLPGEIAGLVALDELVVHGWDVARASGQPYDQDQATLDAVHGFVAPFAASPEGTPGLFGPPIEVADDAPFLDRVIGLTGRDPSWSPKT